MRHILRGRVAGECDGVGILAKRLAGVFCPGFTGKESVALML